MGDTFLNKHLNQTTSGANSARFNAIRMDKGDFKYEIITPP